MHCELDTLTRFVDGLRMERDANIRLLTSAVSVFATFGFKRTTMGDLAEAAGLSRPALYLRYPGKEAIFEAAFERFTQEALDTIVAGLPDYDSTFEKVRFAFEHWTLRPFEYLQRFPKAKDLVDCSLGFARGKVDHFSGIFEGIVAKVLQESEAAGTRWAIAPDELARFMVSAARGLKATAADVETLNHDLELMLAIVFAGIPATQSLRDAAE